MPTYQYRCTECGHDLEAVQKFTDASLTECPNCGGPLRKIFNAVGVVFKGSGFYRTDSREAGKDKSSRDKSDSGASEKATTSAESGSKESAAAATPKTDSSTPSNGSAKPAGSDSGSGTKKTPAAASSTGSAGSSS